MKSGTLNEVSSQESGEEKDFGGRTPCSFALLNKIKQQILQKIQDAVSFEIELQKNMPKTEQSE